MSELLCVNFILKYDFILVLLYTIGHGNHRVWVKKGWKPKSQEAKKVISSSFLFKEVRVLKFFYLPAYRYGCRLLNVEYYYYSPADRPSYIVIAIVPYSYFSYYSSSVLLRPFPVVQKTQITHGKFGIGRDAGKCFHYLVKVIV